MEGSANVRWRSLIYWSHFCAAWGERMWEFSAGLLLLTLGGGQSLKLPAVLACAMLFTQLVFGGRVGRIVDSGSAMRTPLIAFLAQNCAIALAAISAALSLHLSDGHKPNVHIGASLIVFFSCLARIASIGSTLSVENHWAVALSAGDREVLATLNSQMRRIDLSCKILAPIASGAIMSAYSPAVAACAVALVNLVAWPVEALSLLRVYNDPCCRKLLEARSPQPATNDKSGQSVHSGGLKFYFSQRNIWPSTLALSFLHLTVLSFGQLMTAYVMTLGIPAAVVASYRSIGEVFGVTATILAPRAVNRIGPARSATIFIWFQLSMLVPSAIGASSWARNNLPAVTSSLMLVGGVGVSRLGLWGFDLSVTQLMQERVNPPSAIGSFCGVQKSIEAMFGTIAGLLGVVLSDPEQFQYLAFGSWISVCSTAVLHSLAAACLYSSDQTQAPNHVPLLGKA